MLNRSVYYCLAELFENLICGSKSEPQCLYGKRTITGHARLPGHTGRDQHNLSARQALSDAIWFVALDCALGVDVRDIGGDTWCTLDIVEGELADSWIELEQEGERLADSAAGAENSDLGELYEHNVSLIIQCLLDGRYWDRTHVACGSAESSPLDSAEDRLSCSCGEHDCD